MLLGNASDVVAVSSSLERNLNQCLLSSFTVDSPATDANYTPGKDTENWDYRVVYDVWVRKAAFGAAGFGSCRHRRGSGPLSPGSPGTMCPSVAIFAELCAGDPLRDRIGRLAGVSTPTPG
jgi:hypothetical protein